MIREIDSCLREDGYKFLKIQPLEAGVYYKYVGGTARIVLGVNIHEGFIFDTEQLYELQGKLRDLFLHPQGKFPEYPTDTVIYQVELLTLILTEHTEEYRKLCTKVHGVWLCDLSCKRLIIYENQPAEYYGLGDKLQEIFEHKKSYQEDAAVFPSRQGMNRIPIASILIVAANVIVFFLISLWGDTKDALFMYEHGAMYPPSVMEEGEWYRIFSAMFLHFGAEHLANNMIMLFFAGRYLEEAVGRIKYVIIYFVSGLGGGLLSLAVMVRTGDIAVSAGASGAVFGVIGALLGVALRNRGRFESLTTRGLLFMIALSLYYGFASTGVDNWCHIGGLFCGFVAGFILYRHGKD